MSRDKQRITYYTPINTQNCALGVLENWIWQIEPTKELTQFIYFSPGNENRIMMMIQMMKEKYGVILTDGWDGTFQKPNTDGAE